MIVKKGFSMDDKKRKESYCLETFLNLYGIIPTK